LLGDGYETDRAAIELVNKLGEIQKRSTQTVDLINHDAVNASLIHILQELLKPGAIDIAPTVPAVIVVGTVQSPPEMFLALDVSLGTLALGIEGIEILVKALFCRFASVDCTTQEFLGLHLR
jgi:hypothetical protein